MVRPWTVNSPGALVEIEDGLWCVDDTVPGLDGATRRMTIVRRRDGGLLFYNAIPLPDAQLAEVKKLGTPAQLFIPNQFHMLDAHAFSKRLGLRVYGPLIGLPAIRAVVPEVQAFSELPGDADITVHTVDGFKTGEGCLLVRRPKGAVFLTADVVCNAAHGPGFNGFMMKLIGFTGSAPKLPRPVRLRVGRNMQLVRELLERVAGIENLKTLIPSHGDVFRGDVPATLRSIAASL